MSTNRIADKIATTKTSGPLTRRDVLSTGTQAAITAGLLETAPSILGAAQPEDRVAIGIHLFGPAPKMKTLRSADKTAAPRETLHAAFHPVASTAVLVPSPRAAHDVSFTERYKHLRFLPGGYVAAGWTAEQHTYTFAEGLTLSTSTRVPGASHDNPVLRAALGGASVLPTAVLNHGLGRQLDAAARLALQARGLALKHVSLLAALGGFGSEMDQRRLTAMRQLAESLAALHEFAARQGATDRLLIYTDSDVPQNIAEQDGKPAQITLNAPEGLFARGLEEGLASWIGLA